MADWYDSQIPEAQAAFDTVLEYLVQRPIEDWGRPEFAPLTGKHSKLGELRFDVRKLEYRPLGCFGPGKAVFTLLLGSTKKGSQYDPRSALDTALERRDIVFKDAGRSHDFDF